MKKTEYSIKLMAGDFPIDKSVKQAWIILDGIDLHVVVYSDRRVRITQWVSKKYPKAKIVKKTYRY